jgi:hypothetical protein
MTGDLEARLRDAVHAQAEAAILGPDDDSLGAIRTRIRSARRRRRTAAVLGAVALVLAVVTIPRLADDGDRDDLSMASESGDQTTTERPSTTAAPTSPTSPSTETAPTTGATVPAPPPAETTTTAPPTETDTLGDGYQPLWPFPTARAARAWQDTYRTGGQQPWHLDADQTALSFTTGFLGFGEVDRVISHEVGATDAHVTVGYATTDGQASTAAIVHLMRFGTGDDAPWEVVGTTDTGLVLETPDYGTTAHSPVTVAGTITGVDESLRVQVRQASSSAPLGEACCLAAGGDNSPWRTTVAFEGATDPALTIVVSTGGHVQDVERFAITGVRG